MTPVQLLEETEKAVGDPQLPVQHRALISKSNELGSLERVSSIFYTLRMIIMDWLAGTVRLLILETLLCLYRQSSKIEKHWIS